MNIIGICLKKCKIKLISDENPNNIKFAIVNSSYGYYKGSTFTSFKS